MLGGGAERRQVFGGRERAGERSEQADAHRGAFLGLGWPHRVRAGRAADFSASTRSRGSCRSRGYRNLAPGIFVPAGTARRLAAVEALVDHAVEVGVLVLSRDGAALEVLDHVGLAIGVGVGVEAHALAPLVDLARVRHALAHAVDQDLGHDAALDHGARVELLGLAG